MDTLFPIEPAYPEGFSYYPDFINIQEEKYLLEEVRKTGLHSFLFHGYEAKRKVASFGYDYNFENRSLAAGKEIPAFYNGLIKKVADKLLIPETDFAELLITEYPIGAVINWHRDAFPFDLIAGISLLSDCKFQLRPHDKTKQNRKSIISIPVQRRSLYIMKGLSRTEWEHSTAPVKQVRYSITLRTLRNN